MKILVPTDFSNFAEYAFEAACNLGHKFGAEIHLFHVIDFPDNWKSVSKNVASTDAATQKLESDAAQRLEQLQKTALDKGLSCHVQYTDGNFLKKIKHAIEENKIDLVVMGSHGVSGIEELFIGSNTQKVLRKIHTNVLVVKSRLKDINFSKVLFASGLYLRDHEAFGRLLEFIKPFDVKELHVLSVDTSRAFSQPAFAMKDAMKAFKHMASNLNCQTHFYLDFSIESGIRNFSEEYDIDLIALSNHGRSPIKRIFQGSQLEMVINRSKAPVLSIDY